MNKRIEICELSIGLVFLVSGIAKALDVVSFSDLIVEYGFAPLRFLAPLIVLAEIVVGLFLILKIQQKRTALFSIVFLFTLTSIYTYGFVFNDIEDCGCFGKIEILNVSPVFTYIRNIILMLMAFVVWRKRENDVVNKWSIIITAGVGCMVSAIMVYSYCKEDKSDNTFVAKRLNETMLDQFVSTSKDSTYLVFAFSYTCPHCLNSIENLKQYESFGAVDKVIGLSIENPDAERKYKEIFNPKFQTKNYQSKTLFQLTRSLPKAYYIKNDSLIIEFSGELPCAYIFSELMESLKKQDK